MPKVSVQMCCYNGREFIAETLESVLGQTYKDFEIVLIDDGSTDNMAEIIRAFDDPRIRYHYQENRGLAPSRNRSVELSNGEYIAILDQDDLWEPDKLELQVALLDSDPGIGLVYSDAYVVDADNRETDRFFLLHQPYRGRVTTSLIAVNFIPTPAAIFRKSLLHGSVPFRTDLGITEEYELFLRLSLVSDFDYVDKPLARYRWHTTNVSRDTARMLEEEILTLRDFAAGVDDDTIRSAAGRRISERSLSLASAYLCAGSKVDRTKFQSAMGGIKSGKSRFLLNMMYVLPAGTSARLMRALKAVRRLCLGVGRRL